MKKVAGKMRLEAAQYREVAAFAQFGSDLDDETKSKLERGKRLMEIFKQDQYQPLVVGKQVLVFYALINSFIDDVPVDKVNIFEKELFEYTDKHGEDVLKAIAEKGEFDEDLEAKVKDLITNFKKGLDYLEKDEVKK